MEICDYEYVIKNNIENICKGAIYEGLDCGVDGVVDLDLITGQLSYRGENSNYGTDTLHVVEIYRLDRETDMEDVCGCAFCSWAKDDGHCCGQGKLYDCFIHELIKEFREFDLDDCIDTVQSHIQEWGLDMV